MKKLLILLLIFLFIPTLSASAAESVSFSTGSVECRNNRLIDVEVRAQSGRKPSAALFDFYFDKGLLEYRGASAPNGQQRKTAHEGEIVVYFSARKGT